MSTSAFSQSALEDHNLRTTAVAVEVARRAGWSKARQQLLRPSVRPPLEPRAELAQLMELSCFFVQRWEYMPYEAALFPEIIEELRTMARDGFLDPAHVDALAAVSGLNLSQVRDVVSRLPALPPTALKSLKAENHFLMAAALRPMFRHSLARPLWNHSLDIACLAESLARKTGKADPSEAFLAGLLHDVGRLVLWNLPSVRTARYTALLDVGCEPMLAELLLFGFDHTLAGREAMRAWRLPETFAEAIEFHHHPERCQSGLAQVLYLAEHTSGSDEDTPSMARLQLALKHLGLRRAPLTPLETVQSGTSTAVAGEPSSA